MAAVEMGMFTDLDFSNTIHELDNQDVADWEFFVETHGTTIYRQLNKTSGLYQYKVYGELNDVTPEICAQVYLDLEYRKQWDSFAKELYVKECEGKNLIYWNVKFPFPLWNRDYVYGREYREVEEPNRKLYLVLAKSFQTPSIPEKKGVVRVNDFLQSCVLCSNGKGGTKAYMKYYDNPGGNIPTWVINWGAKTGVPQFLTSMDKACRGYPDYKKKNEQKKS